MKTDSNNSGKSEKLKAFLFALSALIIITVIASCAKKDQPVVNQDSVSGADSLAEARWAKTQLDEQRTHTVTSSKLSSEYNQNEVAADNEFKGKAFWVKGRIEDIGKDITDRPYVMLNGDVQCFIANANIVARMNKGETVTLRGTCGGKLGIVFIENCEVAQNL